MKNNDRNLRRRWLRRLALALVLAMLAAMLPVSALAEEAMDETEIYEKSASESEEEEDVISDEPAEEAPGEEEEEAGEDPAVSEEEPEPSEEAPAEEGEDTEPEQDDGFEEMDAPEEPQDETPEIRDSRILITGFLPLDKDEYKLALKPEIELVLQNLPIEVTAEIPGYVDGVPFNVDWICENYETEDYGEFLFTAQFKDETVEIDGRTVRTEDIVLDEDVTMPVIKVIVLAVSGFEPLDESVYTLDEQPSSERAAVKQMKLPKTVKGTLSDSDFEQDFPVDWECEDFDQESDEYLFTAVFSKAAYALEDNVEMPAVLLMVKSPEQTVESFDALTRTVFPVDAKPADEAAAITAMSQLGLKNTVTGKLTGVEESRTFNVTWACANYSATSETGEYTFTSAFDGEEFTLAEGVKMPSVTLKVVSDDEFEVKTNEDGTLAIIGWNAENTETALVIPAKIDGVDVTEVTEGAFKNHPDIKSVTLTDNLRAFPASAFDDGINPETVKLVAYGVYTTLKSEKSFSQMIKTEEVTTTLPWALTDIEAATSSLLTISYDLTVEEGHALLVDSEATVVINEGKTLTNCGSVTGDGKIDNFGTIYSCQMGNAYSVTTRDKDGQPYAPITDHAFGTDGRCQHCHAKKLYFSVPDTLTKVYDGSNTKTLTSSELANFAITNLESGENITITSGEATFNGETVGSHQVRVDLEIDEGAQFYDYLWDAMTVNGTIQARSITDSGITISDIPNQSQTGTNPSVTISYNGRTLTAGTDYELTHSYNNTTGVGTVTIKGIGNFTGTTTKTFKFNTDSSVTKTDRTVTISLKAGHEPTKVYDRTINVSLKASDFTISGVASGDTVRISKISASYDSRDAGDRKVNITFEISQSSTQYNYVLANSGKLTINGKITPKDLVVTPTAGQTKVYGTSDPSYFKGSVTGLMKEDQGSVTGKLGRESGENVGEYKFTAGTLSAGNNYNVVIAQVSGKDVTFSITRKSISQVDVSLDPATISNQKWTGSAIKPEVGLKYQDKKLKEGTDYTVTYSNNVNAGLASVEFTGIGNYEGTRKTQFRILKTVDTNSTVHTGTTGNVTVMNNGGSSMGTIEGDPSDPGTTYHYLLYRDTKSSDYLLVSIMKNTLYFYHDGQYLTADFTGSLANGVNVEFPDTDIKLFVKLPSDLEGSPTVRVNGTKMTMKMDEGADVSDLVKQFIPAVTEEAETTPEEAAQLLGAMIIGGENLGTVLFGEDNLPRGFDLFEEEIVSEAVEEPAETVNGALTENGAVPTEAAEVEQPRMRLLIQPHAMTDAAGEPVYLDEEQTRKKYETLHLRLTNSQIDSLKQRGFEELVYELENAQVRMPLEALTPEIDLANFPDPDAETAQDGDAQTTESFVATTEAPDVIYDDEAVGEPAEAAAQEIGEMQLAPELLAIDMYDFCIEQVDDLALTERETAAMEGRYTLTPLYRVDINAVEGEYPVPEQPADPASTTTIVTPRTADVVEPTLYSMLKVFNNVAGVEDSADAAEAAGNEAFAPVNDAQDDAWNANAAAEEPFELGGDEAAEAEDETWALGCAKLRVEPIEALDELPEGAQELFVAADSALLDEEAVTLSDPNYVTEEFDHYAEFYPTASGLCALVAPVVEEEPEDATEEEEADEVFEPTEDADAPEEQPVVEDEPVEEMPVAPEVEVIEDPDAKYAYSRRSNSGDMIWLIDTQAKTVEFYRQDSGKYLIGDYTGSLMSGLTVQYRETSEIASIHLKFQQTYKFALTDVDGSELLMEQDDVAMIESELNAVR